MGIPNPFKNMEKPAMIRELTPRLFMVYCFMSIGAINFGFDNGWWSSVISLQQFANTFGTYDPVTKQNILSSTYQSAGSGTGNAGLFIGCMIASPIIKTIGRKYTVLVIIAFAFLGMLIQNVVPNYWGVMVGRMINSISMGLEANNIPMYFAELAPPSIRGSLINFYQWWQIIGVIMSRGVCYQANLNFPVGSDNADWAWRLVMVVQFIIPALLLGVFWILPESPRWHISKGQREKALEALVYIRKGAATTAEVEEELILMERAVEEQEHFHKVTSYMDCFRGSNGRRTMIACVVQALEQLGGNAFMASYSVIFMSQVGITNSLAASLGRTAMALAGATLAFYFADKVGRRPLLIWTAFVMWAGLWITSGIAGFLPGGVSGGPLAQFLVFLIFVWTLCSTGGWGSCVWMITAEVSTNQLREKTVSIATSCSFIVVLLVSYINPYVQGAPGNVGNKIGFIYGSFSLLAMFVVYFFVPELSGRSLEELDELFQAKIPAWRFKDYKCTGIGAQLTMVQNMNADQTTNLKLFGVQPDDISPEPTKAVGEPKVEETTESYKA